MIFGQLFRILLLNLIADGLADINGTTGFPMEDSMAIRVVEFSNGVLDGLGDIEGTTGFPIEDITGPPMEDSGPLMEDYEDSTPFQCNNQNLPGGSDKPSSKARSKSVLSLLLRYKHCSKNYQLIHNFDASSTNLI